MKFKIEDETRKNNDLKCLMIDENSSLSGLKKIAQKCEKICIVVDEQVLNLNQKLYGDSKAESEKIQKSNCKIMIKSFKFFKKLIKFLRRKKIDFDYTIFCKNLSQKKNNNDFMLCAMLETYFFCNPFQRLQKSVQFACNFLDSENNMYDMCDFKDDVCASYRENGSNKPFGCCPTKCRDDNKKVCEKNCLTCKIFMCDFLEQRGFCFFANFVPILKFNLSFWERRVCEGLLFTTYKSTCRILWTFRIFEILIFACLAIVLISFCVFLGIILF